MNAIVTTQSGQSNMAFPAQIIIRATKRSDKISAIQVSSVRLVPLNVSALLLHLETPTICPKDYPGCPTPKEKQTSFLPWPRAAQCPATYFISRSDLAQINVMVKSLVCVFHYTASLLNAGTGFHPRIAITECARTQAGTHSIIVCRMTCGSYLFSTWKSPEESFPDRFVLLPRVRPQHSGLLDGQFLNLSLYQVSDPQRALHKR